MNISDIKEVAIIGDWHGNGACIAKLRLLKKCNIKLLIHLGDLGIGHTAAYEALGDLKPDNYITELENSLDRYDMQMAVNLGNHEAYSYIYDMWAAKGDPDRREPLQLTDHIWILPRGYRFKLAGVSFVSLGGANSIDRYYRDPGRSWWFEEQISDEDVARTLRGGYADVMLVHDSPSPPYCTREIQKIKESPSSWPPAALLYAQPSGEQVTRALEGVKPKLLFHGHWHLAGVREYQMEGVDYKTTTLSLGSEYDPGNIFILDLSSLWGKPLNDLA